MSFYVVLQSWWKNYRGLAIGAVMMMTVVMAVMVAVPYSNNHLRVGRSYKDYSKECSDHAGE